MKNECWRQVMRKEIQAPEENNKRTAEDLPSRKKAIGSKWIYKIKYNSDGSVERCKDCLVMLDNNQD